MELVEPNIKYKDSFLAAVAEYQANKEAIGSRRHYSDLDIDATRSNFSAYIEKLLSQREGKNLPEEHVPVTTYWLVDNDEFIGRVSLRHILSDKLHKDGGHIGYDIRPSMRGRGYGKKILELGLHKAKTLGIENALITCDVGNIPSKKIIEANGGVMENKVMSDEGIEKLRYWIKV